MENEFTKDMSEDEFQEALDELQFTQVGLMRVLHKDERTGRRWRSGEYAIPTEIAVLLRVLRAWKQFGRDPLTVIPAGDARSSPRGKAKKRRKEDAKAADPHEWRDRPQFMAHLDPPGGTMQVCSKCGIVKRADGKNGPCKGVVKVALREADAPATKEKETAK
jgi:hypothetical protein